VLGPGSAVRVVIGALGCASGLGRQPERSHVDPPACYRYNVQRQQAAVSRCHRFCSYVLLCCWQRLSGKRLLATSNKRD
jgi:hypothetical protein